MIVCTRCLHRNDDAVEFCLSCGTFLEWSSDRAVAASAASLNRRAPRRSSPATGRAKSRPPPPRRERSPRDTAPDQEQGANGGPAPPRPARRATGPDTTGLDPEEAALAAAAWRLRQRVAAARGIALDGRESILPPEPPRRGGSGKDPRAANREAGREGDGGGVAASGAPPPGGGTGGLGAFQPRPLEPGDDERRVPRRSVVDDDFAPLPGEVVCSRCAAGNATSRYFCRRCGMALHPEREEPALPAPMVSSRRRPWWWWLFGRRRDDVADTPAPPPDTRSQLRSALPVVAVLGLILAVLGPCRSEIASRIEAARKRVAPQFENVHPARVEASTALPDHPAEAAADGAPNTYWAEGGPTSGEGEGLVFTFDRPVDIGRIGFYNGAQTKPQDFLAQPRPRAIRVVSDTGETVVLTLKDEAAFQDHRLDLRSVETVTMLVTSVYPSPQGGTAASLGEVEFFTRR